MAHRLELDRICVRFGERILLDRVSLAITRGQITGLRGESGSGKTLCALTLQGILPENLALDSGQILLDDVPVSGQEIGKTCAIIMQSPRTCFNPLYTMRTHILESLRAQGFRYDHAMQAHVLALLARLGLDPSVLGRYAHEMSGGMLQRVMIAIALLSGAEFLICDEPTSDLDTLNAREILHILRELCARGSENLQTPQTPAAQSPRENANSKALGVLLISHDERLLHACDRRYVLDSGKACEIGASELGAGAIDSSGADSSAAESIKSTPESSARDVIRRDSKDSSSIDSSSLDSAPASPICASPMLILHNLSKSYPSARHIKPKSSQKPENPLKPQNSKNPASTPVLDALSLSLHSGERLALIGASGSGKSTLARLIARLEPCDSGAIYLPAHWLHEPSPKPQSRILAPDSPPTPESPPKPSSHALDSPPTPQNLARAPISRMSLVARRRFYRRVQLLFQDPLSAFDPRLIIWESIAQGCAALLGVRDRSAQERIILPLCARLGLDERLLFAYPSMLSGGQLARMNLLRALSIDPELLILDEATSALDRARESSVWEFLASGVDSGSFWERDTLDRENIAKNFAESSSLDSSVPNSTPLESASQHSSSPESAPTESSMNKSRKALIFITHDIALARRYCDRIALLDSGRIIEVVRAGECFGSALGRALES